MEETKESCILRPTGQNAIFLRINVSHVKERPSAEFLEHPLYNAMAVSVIEIDPQDVSKCFFHANVAFAGLVLKLCYLGII